MSGGRGAGRQRQAQGGGAAEHALDQQAVARAVDLGGTVDEGEGHLGKLGRHDHREDVDLDHVAGPDRAQHARTASVAVVEGIDAERGMERGGNVVGPAAAEIGHDQARPLGGVPALAVHRKKRPRGRRSPIRSRMSRGM